MVGTTVKTSQGTALSLFSASSCCSMHVQIKDTSSLPTPAARQRCVTLRFFSNFLPFLFVPSFFFTCSLPQHLPGFLPHIPIVAFGKKNSLSHSQKHHPGPYSSPHETSLQAHTISISSILILSSHTLRAFRSFVFPWGDPSWESN